MSSLLASFTVVEIVFLISAILGSLFFVMRTVSMIIGAIGSGNGSSGESAGEIEADADVDIDTNASLDVDADVDINTDTSLDVDTDVDINTDTGLDVDSADITTETPTAEFDTHIGMLDDLDGNGIPDVLETDNLPIKIKNKQIEFSLQNICAFFMMFGLVGLAMTRSSGFSSIPAILAGGVAGTFAAWLFTRLNQSLMKLKSSGNKKISTSIGNTGTVYLRIPADGVGQVEVVVSGRLEICDAVSADNIEIKSGEKIRVIGLKEGKILSVIKNTEKNTEL